LRLQSYIFFSTYANKNEKEPPFLADSFYHCSSAAATALAVSIALARSTPALCSFHSALAIVLLIDECLMIRVSNVYLCLSLSGSKGHLPSLSSLSTLNFKLSFFKL
jgi:hypothetical protein